MFDAPFSFNGRITRSEFGISLILYFIAYLLLLGIIDSSPDNKIMGLLFIPLLWFLWAQGAKRCHDINNSGWMQIIPFYVLWMLFQAGKRGPNEYGEDPKASSSMVAVPVRTGQNDLPIIIDGPMVPASLPEEKISKKPDTIQTTVIEVTNVNYSLIQDVLKNLRGLDITNQLSYEFVDTTSKITVKHRNTSQDLLDLLHRAIENIEVLSVTEGALKIKLK